MNRKTIIVLGVAIVIIAVLFITMVNVSKVKMSFAHTGTATYRYDQKDISKELTDEDFSVICGLFEGKKLYFDSLSCGFSENISLTFNGTEVFCIARDSCPIIYWKNKSKFFKLTESEYEALLEILTNYGFAFPCI